MLKKIKKTKKVEKKGKIFLMKYLMKLRKKKIMYKK